METTTEFGIWLFREIENHRWSQADLAREANTTEVTISRLVNKGRGLGLEVCNGLAEALGYPPDFIARKALTLEYPSRCYQEPGPHR